MPIKLVPCEECDFWSKEFKAAGRTVLGCEPAEPGMCALRWELGSDTTAAGAAPAAPKSAPAKKAAAATPSPRPRGTRRSR